MLKVILATLLAACGVNSNPTTPDSGNALSQPEHPDDRQPPPEPPRQEDAYFCCDSLNSQGKGSGEGCEQILHTVVAGCSKVLHCTDGYTNDEGKVTCTG
ncbi:hypothetical protein [Enhygromyxa salina]|uniref:hypothetical protein n=1 Tax=Enhygromyxa salina TaxID=215803 RepID=UPI0011BA81B5|nr:hypothetical protein [Enhygromyxa salina]